MMSTLSALFLTVWTSYSHAYACTISFLINNEFSDLLFKLFDFVFAAIAVHAVDSSAIFCFFFATCTLFIHIHLPFRVTFASSAPWFLIIAAYLGLVLIKEVFYRPKLVSFNCSTAIAKILILLRWLSCLGIVFVSLVSISSLDIELDGFFAWRFRVHNCIVSDFLHLWKNLLGWWVHGNLTNIFSQSILYHVLTSEHIIWHLLLDWLVLQKVISY